MQIKASAYDPNVVLVTEDDGSSLSIPKRAENPAYQRVLAAIAAGASVLPADVLPLVYGAALAIDARVRTTDATPTEVYRQSLATMTGYGALLSLLGVDGGNGAIRLIRASVVAKRLAGGALLVGAPVVLANHADAGATTWAITATASGNDFVVTCTGAAGRTIDWQLTVDVRSFTPGGS